MMTLRAIAWAKYEAIFYVAFWTDKLKIRKNSLNTNEKCAVFWGQCKWHSSF